MDYPLIGKKTVYIGQEQFDPELVSDEGATVTLTPATMDISSQAGTVSIPTGSYEEMSVTITLIINSVETLMRIFPDIAKKATYTGANGTGQVVFGGGECKAISTKPIVIHNACDTGSSQDVYIPAGLIQNGGEFAIGGTDPTTLELNITPMANEKGYVIFGEGMLDSASHYDPETMAYVKNTVTGSGTQASE